MSADRSLEVGELLARAASPSAARLAHAAADLAIPATARLSERRRAQTLHVLHGLFDFIEDALRRSLSLSLAAAGKAGREAVADLADADPGIVWSRVEAVILSPPLDLLDAALSRAAEHDLSAPLRAVAPADGVLAKLLSRHPDPLLSQRMMDMVVADSRRQDSFGEPRLPFEEIDTAGAGHGAWLAGAALRAFVLERRPIDVGELDRAIEQAVRRLLAERGERDALRCAARLAARLDDVGSLDDIVLAALAREGHILMLAAATARRAGIEPMLALRTILAPAASGFLVLMRAIGSSNDSASAIASVMMAAGDDPTPVAVQLRLIEDLSLAEARAQVELWRRDPAYVSAVAALKGRERM